MEWVKIVSVYVSSHAGSDANVAYLGFPYVVFVKLAGEVFFEAAVVEVVCVIVGAIKDFVVG